MTKDTPRTSEVAKQCIGTGSPMSYVRAIDLCRTLERELAAAEKRADDASMANGMQAANIKQLSKELAAAEAKAGEWKMKHDAVVSVGQKRIAELEAELAGLEKEFSLLHTNYAAACAELAECKRDAERYNFVRVLSPQSFTAIWTRCLHEDIKFDAAIDAARGKD